MNKASPVDMRKALEIVQELKQAGVLFVPVPVLDQNDHQAMLQEMYRRIEKIAKEAEL